MKQFLQGLKIFVAIIVLFGGMQYIYAWSAPASSAPGGNSVAPLNVSVLDQIKNGSLGLGGLVNSGNTLFTAGVKITSGSPGLGKVLVSDAEGNARWSSVSDILSATSTIAGGCPAGSELMTITGVNREFCGYSRTTGSTAYCDAFGSEYDKNLGCWDIGHGNNHGIQSFASGCTAWEGAENYGGQGALFYCEKQRYVPKTAASCTAANTTVGAISAPSGAPAISVGTSVATAGTINDTALSPNPITTCQLQTPYTYYQCDSRYYTGYQPPAFYAAGSLIGEACYVGYSGNTISKYGKTFGPYKYGENSVAHTYPATLVHATSTSCPTGWIDYAGTCI